MRFLLQGLGSFEIHLQSPLQGIFEWAMYEEAAFCGNAELLSGARAEGSLAVVVLPLDLLTVLVWKSRAVRQMDAQS